MKLSWEWKLFLLNTLCQTVVLLYTSISLYIGFRITLPDVYKDDSVHLNRKLLAVFIVANTVGNYICIKLKSHLSLFSRSKSNPNLFMHHNGGLNRNSKHNNFNHYKQRPSSHDKGVNDTGSILLDGIEEDSNNGLGMKNTSLNLAGWYECRDCDELVPPRSRHCPLCRACILKRDHHCFFSGCCIGFHNQRFFTIFCLYGSLGASYNIYTLWTFIQNNYAFFQAWGLISLFPPIFMGSWLMGHTSGRSILFILFLFWSIFIALICSYFFLLQIFLLVRGQTKSELKKKVFPYRSDLLVRNVMSVFGPSKLASLVGFLIPMPFVGYYGDGKNWDDLCQISKIY